MVRGMAPILCLVCSGLVGCWGDSYTEECCTEGDIWCGDGTIIVCGEDCHEERHDCEDVCRGAGFSYTTGCEFDWELEQAVCLCTDDPAAQCECTWGDRACWDHDLLMTCADGCHFAALSCAEFCLLDDPGSLSSCGYDEHMERYDCLCE